MWIFQEVLFFQAMYDIKQKSKQSIHLAYISSKVTTILLSWKQLLSPWEHQRRIAPGPGQGSRLWFGRQSPHAESGSWTSHCQGSVKSAQHCGMYSSLKVKFKLGLLNTLDHLSCNSEYLKKYLSTDCCESDLSVLTYSPPPSPTKMFLNREILKSVLADVWLGYEAGLWTHCYDSKGKYNSKGKYVQACVNYMQILMITELQQLKNHDILRSLFYCQVWPAWLALQIHRMVIDLQHIPMTQSQCHRGN